MIKIFCITILSLVTTVAMANTRVRRVSVIGDQIITVRTALGIATIIQVPDRPNSVVVGDQEAFKVEYLDQAVTIKPLDSSAKTNIYIYTDWKRYNVELISGAGAVADYVVYLENPKEKIEVTEIKWIEFKRSFRNGDILLETKRVAKLKNGVLQIEFYLTSEKKQSIHPEWIWITQGGKTRPINNLILSSLEITPHTKVQSVLQLLASDFESSETFRLEIKRDKTTFLTIKKVDSWK